MNREQMMPSETAEETSGRDFLEATKSIDNYQPELEKEMQVGDYINMSGSEFKRWVSSIPDDDKEALEKLDETGEVKVEIKEIRYTKDDYGNESNKLLVKGGGVTKEIFASLFFNYGRDRFRDIEFEDGISGFNDGLPGDTPDVEIRK